MSFYLHIPHPEELPEDVWLEKMSHLVWLSDSGILGVKFNGKD